MREQYESLKLSVLKDLVKTIGVKGYSSMSKEQLVNICVETEEKLKAEKEAQATVQEENAEPEIRDRKNTEDTIKSEKVPETVQKKTASRKNKKDIEKSEKTENLTNGEQKPDSSSQESEVSDIREDNSDNKNTAKDSNQPDYDPKLDSHVTVSGIFEINQEGYGFIRSDNFVSGDNDVYISAGQIRKFGLRTGDIVTGNTKIKSEKEKFSPLLYISKINGLPPEELQKRCKFEEMTPIFPNEKIRLDIPNAPVSMRIVDLISPVGKGQRGMIVSQPKAGKTTLLKDIARSILYNNKDMHMIILLIDERPEEVTDIKEAIKGPNVEVIYSTFDETPDHHKKVAEMVIERAKRLVENKQDVIILLDSITRLTRAYNQVIPPSGRTLSGGLDPAALHMPKKFFGAARNMREGGSLTILATALVDTGSKMDDVVYEEFKGTGNMELVLDRKLSEKRVFPAIDIPKSGTRNEHLLLSEEELRAINSMRRGFNGLKPDEAVDKVIDMFSKTKNNEEFVNMMLKVKWF